MNKQELAFLTAHFDINVDDDSITARERPKVAELMRSYLSLCEKCERLEKENAAFKDGDFTALEAKRANLKKECAKLESKSDDYKSNMGNLRQRNFMLQETYERLNAIAETFDERMEALVKARDGEMSRLQIAELLPQKSDCAELKKAWWFLFNALRADGGVYEKFELVDKEGWHLGDDWRHYKGVYQSLVS